MTGSGETVTQEIQFSANTMLLLTQQCSCSSVSWSFNLSPYLGENQLAFLVCCLQRN